MTAYTVCAVVVTYHPCADVLENMSRILTQVQDLVVVDNGSSEDELDPLRAASRTLGFRLLENGENLGIAAALNLGVAKAVEGGYGWVATFDQDGLVSDGYFAQAFDSLRNSPHPEKVAIIAPCHIDRATGIQGRPMQNDNADILTAMTSGSLIPTRVIQDAGPFDESLFMDYVDIEFCLRVRRKGWQILPSPAVLYHSLGRTTYYSFLGRRFSATNHSAARRYYITRNRCRLLVRYWMDWPWAWRESKAVLFEAGKIVLVEDNKSKKIRAILQGVAHALLGKQGKVIEL